MSNVRSRIADLPEEKRRLLRKQLGNRQTQERDLRIPRRPDQTGPVPLSSAQERLWVLHRVEPENSAYNVTRAFLIEGKLDIWALEYGLNEVVCRHEVLRTTIEEMGGQPVQVIGSADSFSLSHVDLTCLFGGKRQREMERLVREQAGKLFDLSTDLPIRATLQHIAEEEYLLVVTMHHIAADAWSVALVMRELKVFYGAWSEGRNAALPPLRIQYADFAVWQRAWLQGEALERQLEYWKERLAGAPPVLELPTDRVRPAVQSHCGAVFEFSIANDITVELRAFSYHEGVTLFMSLLAAFQLLLSRYSGQRDISVGSPIANRYRIELEGLIGFFVNTQVLRTDLTGDLTFRELLGRVREVCVGAQAHQYAPFEKLVEVLQPVRDMSHSPLFQVMFTLQNAPAHSLDLLGLRVSERLVNDETTMFDLSLDLTEVEGELSGRLEYSTDLFDRETIKRMTDSYRVLLEAIIAHGTSRLSELPTLSDPERRCVLHDWNRTVRVYGEPRDIVGRFEAQVEKAPEACAVACGDERLTYRALNRRANRVAHGLRELGVGPDVLVALLADRGIDFLVLMLGVFKAGGAYVPLDPAHPDGRMRQVLEESRVGYLLCADVYRARAEGLIDEAVVDTAPRLASLAALEAGAKAANNPSRHHTERNLAFIIYTSGSTGQPKGAMVEHRGMFNNLITKVPALGLIERDVIAQTASQCFDISVWQYLTALTCGARVEVFPDAVSRDPARLITELDARGVTILETVPSMIGALLEMAGEGTALAALRWLIPCGEAFPPELCRRWMARFPAMQLLNAYGPAECSDDVSYHPIEKPGTEDHTVPIGRPVDNTRLYLLDRWCEPVPIGVAGEICIGGIQVGRGYLNRPDLTGAVFIPDPFGEAGERLYRTGDLGRYRGDGVLEFSGRIDHQVKIRGHRIEPGEVEACLVAHPEVREACVVAHPVAESVYRLVAYVVGEVREVSVLRAHILNTLPDYMVPAAFVFLEALPLTPNGKVDRKALPAPDIEGQLAHQYVAPRNATEEILASVWAEVLRLERVGIHDNFFELGGDSIKSIQVVSKANALGLELTPRLIFQHQTVAGLAAATATECRGDGYVIVNGAAIDDAPLRPFALAQADEDTLQGILARHPDIEDIYPTTPLQEGLLFHTRLSPGTGIYVMQHPSLIEGEFDVDVFRRAWQSAVDQCEILRTSFSWEAGGRPEQWVHRNVKVPFTHFDWRELSDTERRDRLDAMLLEERSAGFDLSQPASMHVRVATLGQDRYYFVFSFHHILQDDWSTWLLMAKVLRNYEVIRSGGVPSSASEWFYRDYIAWLQAHEPANAETFWRDYMKGLSAPTPLVSERVLRDAEKYGVADHILLLCKQDADLLAVLAARHRVTTNTVVQAAWALTIAHYANRSDIVFGVTVAGRPTDLRGCESAIGLFINAVPLRIRVDPVGELMPWLKKTFDDNLGLRQYEHTPLVDVQGWSDIPRGQSLFQSLLTFENAPVDPSLENMTLKVLDSEGRVHNNYPLTLTVVPGETYHLQLTHDRGLFEDDYVGRMLWHFRHVLETMVRYPELRIAELFLLDDGERQCLLHDWNRTVRVYGEPRDIVGRFEAQVEKAPEACAVACGDERLTYRALNRRANRVAHGLRELGVGPDVLVALLADRGIDFLVLARGIQGGRGLCPLGPGASRRSDAASAGREPCGVSLVRRRVSRARGGVD